MKRSLSTARDFAEAIVETVREPLLVFATDLRVEAATASFYEKFRVTKKETVGRHISELGHRQWDIPRLRKLLKQSKRRTARSMISWWTTSSRTSANAACWSTPCGCAARARGGP